MKKILLLCLIALGMVFTSCTFQRKYMSINTYYENVSSLEKYYNENGFYITGKSTNSENSLIYTGTYIINKYSAVPSFDNDFIFKDTYKLKNENGDYVNFTLSYKVNSFNNIKQESVYEIDYSNVCECETNDPKLYDDLCKNQHLLNFNSLDQKDEEKEINTIGFSIAGIGALLLGFTLIWLKMF